MASYMHKQFVDVFAHLRGRVLDLFNEPCIIEVWEEPVHQSNQALHSQDVCFTAVFKPSMLHLQQP